MSGFKWFRYPHLQWALDRGLTRFLRRHTVRVFLVAVAVMGALLLVGGPANAAPAVTSMVTGSTGAKATCTTLVTSPASSVTQGTEVTLTAMVTPAAAPGNVQFKDGTKDLGTAVPVTNGTAETKMTFDVGSHSLTAVFTPTDPAAFRSSTSPAVSLTVTGSGQGGSSQATTTTGAGGTGGTQTTTTTGAGETGAAQTTTPQGQQSGQSLDRQPLIEIKIGEVPVLDGLTTLDGTERSATDNSRRPILDDEGLLGALL